MPMPDAETLHCSAGLPGEKSVIRTQSRHGEGARQRPAHLRVQEPVDLEDEGRGARPHRGVADVLASDLISLEPNVYSAEKQQHEDAATSGSPIQSMCLTPIVACGTFIK